MFPEEDEEGEELVKPTFDYDPDIDDMDGEWILSYISWVKMCKTYIKISYMTLII